MKTVMLVGLVALLIPCSAWGMVIWNHPQILVDQADLVVQGKIVDLDQAAGQANIMVEETLKGIREGEDSSEVPAEERGEHRNFRQHQLRGEEMEGIWILERADKDGQLDLNYPLRRMQVEQAAQVKALVENFKAIKWSKPVNGLAGAVRMHPTGNQLPVQTFDLYLAVKNVSEKPLNVQQTGGGLAMHFTLKGPDGEREIGMPDTWRGGLEKSVRLEPGQVLYVGFN